MQGDLWFKGSKTPIYNLLNLRNLQSIEIHTEISYNLILQEEITFVKPPQNVVTSDFKKKLLLYSV